MDIILGSSAIDRSEHARRVIRKIAEQESDPKIPKHAIPMGIAEHLARFPHVCDTCGLPYWDQDEYGIGHIGCRGAPRSAPGFSS
jgi:hypothetical protein